MTASEVYELALRTERRLPSLEQIILNNTVYAVLYAANVIQGRWPEAEPVVLQSPEFAYKYALLVIGKRWPDAEPVIKKNPYWTFYYAKNVIKGRWIEAEMRLYLGGNTKEYTDYFFDEPVVNKNKVDIIQWERMNLPGYFAPASLFEDKVSLLDMVIE